MNANAEVTMSLTGTRMIDVINVGKRNKVCYTVA